MRRVLILVLVLVALAVLWLLRGPIWSGITGLFEPEPTAPSEELAADAQGKLDGLAAGDGSGRVALGELELQSLLVYRYAQWIPPFVVEPRIQLEGDRVRLAGRVPTSRIPRLDALGDVAGLLPDTTELALSGQVVPVSGGGAALAVDEVSAARVPLPRRLIAPALRQLGREDRPQLPEDAIPLPLPSGATTAYVRNDSLVLLRAGAAEPGDR